MCNPWYSRLSKQRHPVYSMIQTPTPFLKTKVSATIARGLTAVLMVTWFTVSGTGTIAATTDTDGDRSRSSEFQPTTSGGTIWNSGPQPQQQSIESSPQSRSLIETGATANAQSAKPMASKNASARLNSGREDENPLQSNPLPSISRSSEIKTKHAKSSNVQVGTTEFTLAEQPKLGDRFSHGPAQTDRRAFAVDPSPVDFSPTPTNPELPYNGQNEAWVYEGKTLNANRRPLLELGRPWYQLGELKPSSTILGSHNLVSPQFLIYGDYRMAYANSKLPGRQNTSQMAFELNMNFDLRLTGTERFTAFIAPLDNGRNSRYLFDDDRYVEEYDLDVEFGMFEGDLGGIVGGMVNQTLPFDLPFAMGVMPLLVQNGVWMEDAVLGVAATIPARNSRRLDISNMDITFFAAYDNIDSPAFEGDDDAAKMYGVMSFIEAMGGYFEIDYAFLEDRNRARDRSYHNLGFAFSRRYGRFVSNSVRMIFNMGQEPIGGGQTADGQLLLIENALITSRPQSFVPYFNFFAGFDRPQSVARAAVAGGILRNTGILFESDGMTGFPILDDSANDTWGGSVGLNILTPDWSQQLILEASWVQTMGDAPDRVANDDQYGLGARYQIPLSNAWILRSDAMYGYLRGEPDIHGVRMELRSKF